VTAVHPESSSVSGVRNTEISLHNACIAEFAFATCSQGIAYKVVTLVHKCLNGRAPSYLADICIPVDTLPGRQQLRSAAAGQLLVPRTSTNIGRCGFHCCGPATWNALPVSLCTDNSSSDTCSASDVDCCYLRCSIY